MRMNGSCAGGTGAFIDEMAKLMGVGTESGEFEQLASRGNDRPRGLGPLRRVRKDRYPAAAQRGHSYHRPRALSALHAVARQTIGGRASGIDIEPPVISRAVRSPTTPHWSACSGSN